LAEYQKFKEVAQVLSSKEMESSHIYYRAAPILPKDDFILEASLFELIDAFKNVLEEMPDNVKEILYEEIPIEQKIREVLDLLEGKQYVHFIEIMKLQKTRHDLIVCFMAILELMRLKQIVARQTEQTEDIRIYRVQMPAVEASRQPEQELFAANTTADKGVVHGEDGSQTDR